MSKKSAATVVVAPVAPVTVKVPFIKGVCEKSPFRPKTSRQAWYDACAALVGQPVQALLDQHAASPISVHVRGNKAGLPENGAEWVNWLVKQGVLTVGE